MTRNGNPIRSFVVWLAAAIFATAPLPAQSSDLPLVTTTHTSALNISADTRRVTVTVSDAWEGAPPLSYVVVPPGARRPEDESISAVVELPVRRIASLATPALAHLDDLGALERVVAVDELDYVYNRQVLDAAQAGRIVEVGGGADLNLERLIAAEPDVVIATAYGADDPTVSRIQAAGIPVVVYADWREHDPLARAEWIKLFGVLVERTTTAQKIFARRARRYEALADRVEQTVTHRPSIMANAPWQGSWPVPAGNSYIARLFADAGGEYLWADRTGTGSRFLDLESVLSRGAAAEYWINLNVGWTERADVRGADSRLTAFAPYQSRQMYHHNARVRPTGANDFWESGAGRPDLVLADLVHILHPELLPGHELVYYRRLDP